MKAASLQFGLLLRQSMKVLYVRWKAVILGILLLFSAALPIDVLLTSLLESPDPPPAEALLVSLVLFVALFIACFAGYAYFLLLATAKAKTFAEAAERSPRFLVPLLKVIGWTLVVYITHFWYVLLLWAITVAALLLEPAVGALLLIAAVAISMLPAFQLAFAPYICVEEKKKPRECVLLSLKRTKTVFWNVLGNYLLLCLLIIGIGIAMLILFLLGVFVFTVLVTAAGWLGVITALIFGLPGIIAYVLSYFFLHLLPIFFLAQIAKALQPR